MAGVVAPAFADYDELTTNGGRVGGAGFGDGGLEDGGAWWEEFADSGCYGLAFAFGLPRSGLQDVGDVCDAVTEGASDI